jgi:hypothetical protein
MEERMARVREACRVANCLDFIERWDEGFDTVSCGMVCHGVSLGPCSFLHESIYMTGSPLDVVAYSFVDHTSHLFMTLAMRR